MSDDEALRDRLADGLRDAFSASFGPGLPFQHMADWIMPVIREYAERESDARAEAAHAKGYQQGCRDTRDLFGAPEWRCPACGAVTRAQMAATSPDPHPGGTNPVAARVGTDGPA